MNRHKAERIKRPNTRTTQHVTKVVAGIPTVKPKYFLFGRVQTEILIRLI